MTNNFTRVFTMGCDASTAYRVYTSDQHWRKSRIYGDITWTGNPWDKGSFRDVEVLLPVPHKRRQIVQTVEPGRFFAILTHGNQYTTQTSLYFKQLSNHVTEVTWNVEIAGDSPDPSMSVEEFMEMFYQNMKLEAERIKDELQSAEDQS
jgi:hypothetical protein